MAEYAPTHLIWGLTNTKNKNSLKMPNKTSKKRKTLKQLEDKYFGSIKKKNRQQYEEQVKKVLDEFANQEKTYCSICSNVFNMSYTDFCYQCLSDLKEIILAKRAFAANHHIDEPYIQNNSSFIDNSLKPATLQTYSNINLYKLSNG